MTEPLKTAVNAVSSSLLIDLEELRVGMFIELDVGWMNHPFPTSCFRVSSLQQIEILRRLGLRQVCYVPSKSVQSVVAAAQRRASGETDPDTAGDEPDSDEGDTPDAGAAPVLDAAYEMLQERCRERYQQAVSVYAAITFSVDEAPEPARANVEALVRQDVAQLMATENYAVHMLTRVTVQRPALHAVNVMVLSMLLGRALGLGQEELQSLSAAALLHDIGKIRLPRHIGEPGSPLSRPDRQRYEEHVAHSVDLVRRMGFASDVMQAVGQHHEMADGSGFPRRLSLAEIGRCGQILALVNRYDRLCNPLHGEMAYTPHEALAHLYVQERQRFDRAAVLAPFIRMMGVYPPGSIVQLDDGRYARVVASNSRQPLRPCVQLFDGHARRNEGQLVDLACDGARSIRRSVRPELLPDEMLASFVRPHHCYFFGRVVPSAFGEGGGR